MCKVDDKSDPHHTLTCQGCKRVRRVERTAAKVTLDEVARQFALDTK
jgi:hypothetical protein